MCKKTKKESNDSTIHVTPSGFVQKDAGFVRMDTNAKSTPQPPSGPVKLTVSVEESCAKRRERQLSRFRDRGGFVVLCSMHSTYLIFWLSLTQHIQAIS